VPSDFAANTRRRAVFWDRDGTLMEDVDYCSDPARVRAFPNAGAALAELDQAGFLNIIVTNQSGIGRGYFTEAEFDRVQAELLRQLAPGRITATYFCPACPPEESPRRKPGIGMITEAAADHGVDLAASFLVGDKPSDIECGRAAGLRTVLVLTGYGSQAGNTGADFVAKDIEEAATFILRT
jgi:D-glycero-D-manno-heptose 1,7-bisphosphate phosphatase